MIVRRQEGMTEFIPSPHEKREGLIRDHALELLADVATQARLAEEFAAPVCVGTRTGRRAAHPEPGENGAPGGRWGPVYGEILTFDDPKTRLPAIDRLEGFLPGGPSLYRRVLVPASTRGRRVLVWLYVEGAGMRRPARRLADGVWRAWGRRLPEIS